MIYKEIKCGSGLLHSTAHLDDVVPELKVIFVYNSIKKISAVTPLIDLTHEYINKHNAERRIATIIIIVTFSTS